MRTRILTTAVLGVVAVYFLVPVFWLAIAATKSTRGLYESFGLWFHKPQLGENLRLLFSYDHSVYLRWVLNSALYAGGGALIATLVSAAAGYALAKFEFPGREAIFNVILAGVLIPGTALALPLYLLFSKVGLANTYGAVLLPSIVSPFGAYLCRIYAAASVPDEILEAARTDGASEFTIFRVFALRIMWPALVTIFLFQFVSVWNNYFLPLVMLADPKLYPVTLGLASWLSFSDRVPVLNGLAITGSFVSVVPLMIVMAVLQRFWRTGLTEGSAKG